MAKHSEDDFDPVAVDEQNLDRECWNQARYMKNACLNAAVAKRAVADAKTELKVWEAETKLRVRKRPEEYGLSGKPNNDVVEETMLAQPEYRRLCQKIASLQHNLDVFEAEVTALAHKKAMLENSVILYCRDYGGEVRVSKEDREAYQQKQGAGRGGRFSGHQGTRPVDSY